VVAEIKSSATLSLGRIEHPNFSGCLENRTLSSEEENKKQVMPQDKVFAEIKSSATLSLGRIEHSNFSGCLKIRSLSFKEQLCDNPDLHDNPAIDNHRVLDRDFVAILIFCFCYIEYGED
jgi:hypothetical protein